MHQKTFRDAGTITLRLLRELLRTRRSLYFWLLFPSLMLLLFGTIYAGNSSPERSFDVTIPGILVGAALFFSCLGGPVVTLVGERERGTLRRLLVMPISAASYFLGVLAFYVLVAVVQTAVVYGLGALFGARFHGSVLLGAVIIWLSVMIYCGLAFILGARFARRTEDVTGPISAIGVPLLVLGGTFFSPSILPPALRMLAQLDPIYHMIGALRAVSASGAPWETVRYNVIAMALMALVLMAFGVWSFQGLLEREKSQ